MRNFFETVKDFLSFGSNKSAEVAAALVAPVKTAVPSFVAELMANPTKAFADTFPGVTVVAVGGVIDGSDTLAMARVWTSPEGGFKPGCQLYASTAEGKTFAWVSASPAQERDNGKKGNDPGAFLLELDPETGDAKSPVSFPKKRTKFKLSPSARNFSAIEAISDLEVWNLEGDGTRRDLLVIVQFDGEGREETNNRTGATDGNFLQKVSGIIVLELPKMKKKGAFASLPTSSEPVTVRKGGKPTPKPMPASSVPATMAEAVAQAEVEAKSGGADLGEFAKRMLADSNDL